MINEKPISKFNRSFKSINEANTKTEYNTTQVLSSNLFFFTPNNDSAPDSRITPLRSTQDSETPSSKSILDFSLGFMTPTKKTIKTMETNSSKKNK